MGYSIDLKEFFNHLVMAIDEANSGNLKCLNQLRNRIIALQDSKIKNQSVGNAISLCGGCLFACTSRKSLDNNDNTAEIEEEQDDDEQDEENNFGIRMNSNSSEMEQSSQMLQTLSDWFYKSGSKFIENGRNIVYAIFAFCWSGLLGMLSLDNAKGNCVLLIAIMISFLYLFVDMLRYFQTASTSRSSYNRLASGKTDAINIEEKMQDLSECTWAYLIAELALFIVLAVVMSIYLCQAINQIKPY